MNTDIDGFQRGCKLEGLHPLLIVTYKNITISVSFPYYIKFSLKNRFYIQKKKRLICSFQQCFVFSDRFYFSAILIDSFYLVNTFLFILFFFRK